MELELTADADAVAGFARLKGLGAGPGGRPKTQAVKVVWHDSPDHALLRGGLALAERRGDWRLERMMPGAETWLPGQPAPIVVQSPDLAALPSPLAPLAAFDGRRSSRTVRIAETPVIVTIEKGVLRAVTAERAVARIRLEGEAPALRAAALLIAEAIPVAVPVASLAAEAIALATGMPPQARHQGAPVLPEGLADVGAALDHIMGHLLDVILAYAPVAASADASGIEAVHQMRVAVRRARSALAIFAPAMEAEAIEPLNAELRTLGHKLGPTRDWDVFVEETLPAIQAGLPDDPKLVRLISAAARRQREHRAELSAYLAGPMFCRLGIDLAGLLAVGGLRSEGTEPFAQDLGAFSAAVLQHHWKKLVASGKRMEGLDVAGLHRVRLRAKRARYAAEMFASLYPGKAAHRFVKRLTTLQQRLGLLNDGVVAGHLLEELGGSGGRHAYGVGLVAGYMAARVGRIRPRAVAAFEKFRRPVPYWG